VRHGGGAHHDVARHCDGEVAVLECPGHPGGEDQHPADLHQHGQAVGGVVGVVGGCEPGEVHPRPPDGEEHHREAGQGGPEMTLDQGVVEAGAGLGHGHDERQVEEQLERCGRPVGLGRVPGEHGHVQLHATILPHARAP
jgi:hypothetical protein